MTQPPPGWYADPAGQPQRRYWDGETWTDHVAEPGPTWNVTAELGRDLDQLAGDGRRAKIAVFVALPFYAVTPILQGSQIRQSREVIADLREQLRQPQAGVQVEPYSPPATSTFGSGASVPNLIIGVVFLIWFHRAVSVARRLGRPARRTPGWAVGGWLIPFGNFYLPYQSAVDTLRPEEREGRRLVKRWWTAYLVAVIGSVPLGIVAGFGDHVAASLAAGALAFVLWLFAALEARTVIDAVNESLVAEGRSVRGF